MFTQTKIRRSVIFSLVLLILGWTGGSQAEMWHTGSNGLPGATNLSGKGDLSVVQKAQNETNAEQKPPTESVSSYIANGSSAPVIGSRCDRDRCGHAVGEDASRWILYAVDAPAIDSKRRTDRFCQVVAENHPQRDLDHGVNGGTPNRNETDGCTVLSDKAGDICLSDRKLLRQYRDDFLKRAKKGKLYTKLAFMISEKALAVFDDNPQLMPQAKELIEANKEAVIDGLNEKGGYSIEKGDEVISFLQVYSKEAPPLMKMLTYLLRKEMEKKQKKGELSFVSDQKTPQ